MWMRSSSCIWSCGFILHMAITAFLWSRVPSGIISVFSILNFAPNASHHTFSLGLMVLNLSLSLRYRVVSPTKRFITSFSLRLGMVRPWISGSFLSLHARGLMARSKRGHERGSPWWTLHVTWKGLLKTLLIATWV